LTLIGTNFNLRGKIKRLYEFCSNTYLFWAI
jgi:hypothetical protein